MNSLHLPHGGRTLPSLEMATIFAILLSPAVIIAAMALCSAQNPKLLLTSMQTPKYRLPFELSKAQATVPAELSFDNFLGRRTVFAFSIISRLVRSFIHSCSFYVETYNYLFYHSKFLSNFCERFQALTQIIAIMRCRNHYADSRFAFCHGWESD